MSKTDKVVVVGGGVAGLSAAHELAKRGFEVHVYERRDYYGGKAASINIADSPFTTGPAGLPGEHGFRFFPGWYRHLPETLKEIPYKDKTVYNNLVPADTNLLAAYDRDPVSALLRFPTSLGELKTAMRFPAELLRLGLTTDDLSFFFGKLWTFLTSSEERRVQVYDNQTWWDFLEADKRSPEFRTYIVESATRNTVAAKPRQASAYVIAKVVLQTLFDTLTPQTLFDRVLNGPTSEVWIDPWKDYLKGKGVVFHDGAELDSIALRDQKIVGLRFKWVQRARLARARLDFFTEVRRTRDPARLGRARDGAGDPRRTPGELLAELAELLARGATVGPATPPSSPPADVMALVDQVWPPLDRPLSADALTDKGRDEWQAAQQAAMARLRVLYVRRATAAELEPRIRERRQQYDALDLGPLEDEATADLLGAEAAAEESVGADYFVFSLPVEQMAYYINRSESLQQYDPSLRRIILLAEHVEWMAGIQFYLTDVVTITRGHIDLLDSEWALTAISQVQFWKDIEFASRGVGDARGRVKSILSVDISAWDRKGRLLRKEAFNCGREEIAAEVWHQLKESLNRPGKTPMLKDEMLLGWPPGADDGVMPRASYFLDDNIVDVRDRKKQALYGKFFTVRFSANELLRKQEHRGKETETWYMYGQKRELNVEPLLVNRVGALGLRPSARTGISNMFLAADYVRTNSNLATMEGANEAARAAVNEILSASGSREAPCKIYKLQEPFELLRKVDEGLFRRGQQFEDTYADIPVRLAAGMANAATRMAARTVEKFLNLKK